MKCPRCGAPTEVKETRDSRRRRKCLNPNPCGRDGQPYRFTTTEISVAELDKLRADIRRVDEIRRLFWEDFQSREVIPRKPRKPE